MTASTPKVSDLAQKSCMACEGKVSAMGEAEISKLLGQISGWGRDGAAISKTYKFENFYETMAFVNALAWISHRENHHPDLEVGYNKCRVQYSTHSVGGLTENDFICAAKVEGLLRV